MMSRILYSIVLCQAAQMNAPPVLPVLTARADFTANIQSWEGMQYLAVEDFDTRQGQSTDTFDAVQLQQDWIDSQVELLRRFSEVTSLEDKISAVLEMWAAIGILNGAIQPQNLDGNDRPIIIMYLLNQSIPRYPAIQGAINNFYNLYGNGNGLHGQFEQNNYSAVNLNRIRVPATFDATERDSWIELVRLHMFALEHAMNAYMNRDHLLYLNKFRNRVVAELLAYPAPYTVPGNQILSICQGPSWERELYRQNLWARAGSAGVPQSLIQISVNGVNWENEMRQLVSFDVTQVFVPVLNAGGDALQTIAWFMINPGHLAANDLSDIFGANIAAQIAAKNQEARDALRDLFVRQALRLAAFDNYVLLAGLTHALWMTRGDDMTTRWNRNLYKRSLMRGGKRSWRQWLQEEVLHLSDDEATKEIVKSMIEVVTDVSRSEWRKSRAAALVSQELLLHYQSEAATDGSGTATDDSIQDSQLSAQ